MYMLVFMTCMYCMDLDKAVNKHTYEVEMDLQSVWEQTPSKTYVHAHIWFPFGKGNSQLGLLSRSTPIMDLCSQAVEAAGSRLGLKPRLLCPSQRVLLRRAGISAWPSVALDYWKSVWWHTEHHWAQQAPPMNPDLWPPHIWVWDAVTMATSVCTEASAHQDQVFGVCMQVYGTDCGKRAWEETFGSDVAAAAQFWLTARFLWTCWFKRVFVWVERSHLSSTSYLCQQLQLHSIQSSLHHTVLAPACTTRSL